ncbi:hypothetical protein AV926_16010 [Myroides marinus]|uniref:DUF4838 domain-containing protein n=1 Tax=Myroides marinus TaxID=703342 RepID=A0A163WG68_9FLAO|nr:DUF4838 domain-containing protein [Myroides marinus]KZE76310.1 hypothetical protein AV926_16010 [Myroides marinus]
MWFSKRISLLLFICLIATSSCSADNTVNLAADRYIIYVDEGTPSALWGDYLYRHLRNHTKNKDIVTLSKSEERKETNANTKHIYIGLNPLLDKDFCIAHNKEELRIKTRDIASTEWVVYQLIEAISQVDKRFKTDDLPPAILDFSTFCGTHDFGYREPYYQENLLVDQSGVLGNNNVELDWGIWGHNILKALPKPVKNSIYAKVDGEINKEQLCFTSGDLYAALSEYIIDNYGYGVEEDERYRFMIAPLDNSIVCNCGGCYDLNKSSNNASESVAFLINKLARRFPKYEFYTIAYLSTKTIPKVGLEANVGVFISTIDFPKGIAIDSDYLSKKEVKNLLYDIEQWHTKTSKILLWDYSSNFDDYLSPIPVLYGAQKQFKYFKDKGVSGVFMNASGYDYSSFSDVHNYVLTALMKNVELDVDTLIQRYFEKFYPKNATLLTTYYTKLEKTYESKKIPYNLYGSPSEIFNTYLNEQEFVVFYKALGKSLKITTGEELKRLNRLYKALTFTRLQLAYYKGIKPNGTALLKGHKVVFKSEIKQWVNILKSSSKSGISSYKEADGDLSVYTSVWDDMLLKGEFENLLLTEKLLFKNEKGQLIEQSKLLNDGLIGFRSDYHFGWYISNAKELHVEFSTKHIEGIKSLNLRFLVDKRHRFKAPTHIEIWSDGLLIKTVNASSYHLLGKTAEASINLDFKGSNNMKLIFFKSVGDRITTALDEVQITN